MEGMNPGSGDVGHKEVTIRDAEEIIDPEPNETEPGTDPRDFFKLTRFQKLGEQLDRDPSHPWQDIYSDDLLIQTEFGAIIGGTSYSPDPETGELYSGLLLAESPAVGEGSSIFIKNLDVNHRAIIIEVIKEFAPAMPREARNTYAKTVISGLKQVDNSYPPELISLQLNEFSLSQLPDRSQAESTAAIDSIDWGTEPPDSEKQEQVQGLLALVSQKMSSVAFEVRLAELQDDIQHAFLDDPFGRNYIALITSIAKWPTISEPQNARDFESLQRDKPTGFPITNQIKRRFHSVEELTSVLSDLPVEPFPAEMQVPGRLIPSGGKTAEMVDLRSVVGGRLDDNSWTVSRTTGRGPENIYHLVQQLEQDEEGATGQDHPITVDEFRGRYYINTDGRHRTAALKALGVSIYPMLVTHLVDPSELPFRHSTP